MKIKVRAKLLNDEGKPVGYYGLKRIRPGEVFYIDSEKHFPKKWMERVGADAVSQAAPKKNGPRATQDTVPPSTPPQETETAETEEVTGGGGSSGDAEVI